MQSHEVYELTNPQKSIWYTEQYYKGTAINNICGSVLIEQYVNLDLLNNAINKFIENNDSFKIRLKLIDGNVYQYFSDNEFYKFEKIDLKNQSEIEKYAVQMVKQPFEIIDSKLFEFKLFKLSNSFGGFIVNAHHLISDAATFSFIATEVTSYYSMLQKNETIPKKEYSYVDYIKSEKDYLTSNRFEKDKEYWNELLSPLPEIATIPTLKNNEQDSCLSKRTECAFDSEYMDKIKNFCKVHNISIYNFLIAIYSLYIGRVNNLDTFLVGTPILNRTSYAEKHTSGMYISTSILNININNDLSFVEFAQEIAKSSISLLRHQKYTYQYIIDDLRKKDKTIPNLYNIMISYQITKATDLNSDIQYESKWYANSCISNDLDIHFHDNNNTGNLLVEYDYKESKYTDTDMENLHKRILHIINQILSNENSNLKDIEIVTNEEKNEILTKFNNNKFNYPQDKTIIELFQEQVEKNPNNIAIVFGNKKLTYKELDNLSNSLASHILKYNVKYEDKIAIFLDKSIEMIVSILAILKTNCAYVPIDITYPEERINYILSDSNCNIILTRKTLINTEFKNRTVLFLDNLDNLNNNTYTYKKVSPSSLAYVMYTSGSTGKPKGVMIEHKNIIRLVKNPNYIKFDKHERILQTGSIVFDACTFEIWAALLNGFELYILSKEDLLNPNFLSNYLLENKITILWLTAPLFNQLCDINPTMFNSVKYLLTGGDVLSPKHINKAMDYNPNLKIINGYGPTENTTFSCCLNIDKKYSSNIPIGYPISGTLCYVVSETCSLQPISVPGELWVGGDGVGRGYLNRKDLTLEKFIPNPFGNGKIYKTGDLVRWLPNGTIDFIGRIDNQVKIRGFRVELNEIENIISTIPYISKSYTMIRNIKENKSIVTYFTSNKKVNTKEIITFLQKQLPSYMIPNYFIQMLELPLNVNGKVDKNRLPEPKINNKNKNIILPTTQKQKELKRLFEDTLQKENISIDDNFFELGGDSLSAIKLSTKIYDKMNVQIGIKYLFENPTISKLAELLDNLSNIENKNIITKAKEMNYYPTSSAQKRMYYSSLADGKQSTLYNISGGLILDKELDREKLNNCFNLLIKENESLRTYFEVENGEIVQKICKDVPFKVENKMVNHSNTNKIIKDFIKPFDLSKAPLIRAQTTKLKNGKMLLLIDMHHIISDGETIKIIANELSNLYNNNYEESKKIDYKDFAVWENQQQFENQEKYWLSKLGDELPTLELPTNYPRPSIQSFQGDSIIKKLDKAIVDDINKICNKLNITPYMLLISIYYILLYTYSSTNDLIIGTPVVGRKNEQLQNIVGMFVNTLPIRNKIDSKEIFSKFAEKVKNTCIQAFENQEYPFDKLIQKLNIKKDTSRNALFDVLFTYQNGDYPNIKFDDISAQFYALTSDISKFDITLEAVMTPQSLTLRFEYCTKLFDKEFISNMSKHYINILKLILKNVNIPISNIRIISKKEKNALLKEGTCSNSDYEKDKNVINLFEKQVLETPDDIALVYNNKKLTYKELNEKSNQLATYMVEKYHIQKQDKIGIFVRKSLESIISILAILKTGAIFVPIDVEYPDDRIDYILKDSKASLVLTTQEFEERIVDIPKVNIELNSNIYISDKKGNLINATSSDDLIYIMYTSGSTGKPKGVMVEHKNVIRLVRNTNYIDFSQKHNILQTGSIVFDACTFEIWGTLLNGGTLYLLDKENMLNQNYFESYLKNNNITTIFLTTALFNQYCESSSTMFANLQNLLTGGEAVSCKHMQLALKNYPNLNIIHVYGPTENTTFSTYYKVSTIENNTIPIGKAISNSTTYIVSPNGNLQPKGVPGELWVGGDGIARGYLNREDLTNEKFIDNPFGNGKVYKTGDLVKMLPDGNIQFIGRIDNQVKIRGFRIELSEIDNIIKQYPDILEVYTLVKDINNNKTILTYFTASRNLNISNITLYLQEKLPYYMIPQYIIQLDSFPLTINGKIDKLKLPLPENTTKNKYVAPENEEQEKLCEIWKKLFNIKKVSILDNFFELGGDSLLAIKLQTEALKYDININYSDIFEYQTIKAISQKRKNNQLYEIDEYYDYSKINELLKINQFSNIEEDTGEKDIGNLLLFGSTGFLGAHILDEYLSTTNGKVYCLVRNKNNEDAEERLKNILHFYFNNKYNNEFGKRIFVVYGDITKKDFGLNKDEYNLLGENIDTVINSAALVKHFGDFDMFNSINVLGTKNIIKYCKKFNKKLYHISTMSVAGMSEIDKKLINEDERIIYGETQFYIGQNLKNPYVYTKFQAEREILEQINNGLNACILRMGNIFNRVSDGKFQINVSENAYINRIKAILNLGVIQNRFINHALEFTPVDSSAEAIIKIAKHDPKFNVLHIFNTNFINFSNIIAILNKLGYKLELVNDNSFSTEIKKFLKDDTLKNKISGLIPDLNKDKTLSLVAKTLPDGFFTTQYLKSIGFNWPEIDERYVEQFLNYFKKIGYIE